MGKPLTLEEFWSRVNKNGPIPEHRPELGPCWIYTTRNGKQATYGPRWLAKQILGPMPSEAFVCHHCDNPICVNINHWFIGTRKDNMQDALKKGRMVFQQPGHSEKMSTAARAAWTRPEMKTKYSTAVRAACARPEVRARMSVAARAAHARPEVKAKRSEISRTVMARSEVKAKISATLRATWAKRKEEAGGP